MGTLQTYACHLDSKSASEVTYKNIYSMETQRASLLCHEGTQGNFLSLTSIHHNAKEALRLGLPFRERTS
jgi:hypothetical protein